jgi:4-hydroxybenzoate polyprenyltransferase
VTGSTARAGVRDWLSLVKFSHTVFALPFALIALLVAAEGRPEPAVLGLVVVAMAAARSAAMAYNRYADRTIDAENPRTQGREIPRGVLGPGAVLVFTAVCCGVFVGAAALLGPACLWLSVPTLAVLLGYSHAKRFTSLAHLWLGLALGIAPVAAWLAVRGVFTTDILAAVVLGVGVMVWVAGFDILYACQDEEFDRARGLHSIPVRLGAAGALALARVLHVLAMLGFVGFALGTGRGAAFYAGLAGAGLLLAAQHRLVRPGDLARIDMAFFTMNGSVGLLLLAATAADLYLFGG